MARSRRPQSADTRHPPKMMSIENGAATLAFAPPRGRVEKIVLRERAGSFSIRVIRRVFEVAREFARAERPSATLTEDEQDLLDLGGLPDRQAEAVANTARTVTAYAQLLLQTLSVAEAAERLSVDPSRVRQRLTSRPPTLYGIKRGAEWLLPRFQFARDRQEVPGIGVVVGRLDPELHPLEVVGWFLTPNPDLLGEDDETPISPVDWLKSGNSPKVVADLAAEL